MTMICEMTASGKIAAMAVTMFKVIGTGWALTIVFLVLLYTAVGAIAGKNPIACLWNMLPAYLTGLSIASSSAVIPVTLECCERNGVSEELFAFLMALTIFSTLKISSEPFRFIIFIVQAFLYHVNNNYF